jgi:hypothetical protein
VRVATFGYELSKQATREEVIDRYDSISLAIRVFCEENPVRAVYVEDYAYAQHSQSIAGLHESGGIVKRDLYRSLGRAPIPVTASTARKTLLQKLPRQNGIKQWVEANVRRLKGEAIYWNGDEIDAFVIANHGLMLEGGTPLSFPGT